jgi:ketosteroid isomerase-like protein
MGLACMGSKNASAGVELLRQVYQAFNRREFETVLKMMHAEVDWPNAAEGTRVHGPDAVRQYWKRQFETLDSTVEPQVFTNEPDGRIAVKVHQVVRDKSGRTVADRMVEHVYTLRDGLIASMEIRNANN